MGTQVFFFIIVSYIHIHFKKICTKYHIKKLKTEKNHEKNEMTYRRNTLRPQARSEERVPLLRQQARRSEGEQREIWRW